MAFSLLRQFLLFSTIALFGLSGAVPSSAAAGAPIDEKPLSFKFENERLESILNFLSEKTNFEIVYSGIRATKARITCSIEATSLTTVLEQLLHATSISFNIFEDSRIVRLRSNEEPRKSATLYGRVVADDTGEPLDAVNVFLANTMMGSSTDDAGFFIIPGVPQGTFDLVASRLGYGVKVQKEISRSSYDEPLLIRLKTKPFQAPEIEVSAKALRKWEKNLAKFEKLFFSSTENSHGCKIVNPTVLEFTNGKNDFFVAKAHEPLIIENQALGYKTTYVLQFFGASKSMIRMRGYSRFEEMTPHSPEQKQWWASNRMAVYSGSLRHFLATLCRSGQMLVTLPDESVVVNDSFLGQTGFQVFLTDNPWESRDVTVVTKPEVLLHPAELAHQRVLKFPKFLMVHYNREEAEWNYRDYGAQSGLPDAQVSLVTMTADSIIADTYGNIYDSNGVRVDGAGLRTFGYWSWERMADRLPWDFIQPSNEAISPTLAEQTSLQE